VSGEYSLDTIESLSLPEMTKEVMRKFNVDKETAERIITDRNVFALEKMNKWIRNMKKIQKGKADYIYSLTRRLKRGDKSVLDELEKKILELCVES